MKASGNQTKIHYKGTKTDEDFIVFVDSEEDLKKWKGDKSIPLAQVVGLFKVFVTHKHGAQGTYDEASVRRGSTWFYAREVRIQERQHGYIECSLEEYLVFTWELTARLGMDGTGWDMKE
ncbi:hypothetical protein EYC80_006067 [Monilinia laxa]|uniref:Ribosome maturation protein SDO1/SBDS N-terminal domain-containing protein n=1 Tax=Monilinia laxa TaxID=61186 RepID=A0A5N6KG83_MONLA|nr:hypothetical protein EYC80_006067 [Monilinia laxa]